MPVSCLQCSEGLTAPVGNSQLTGISAAAAAAVVLDSALLVLVSEPCEALCLFSANTGEA